MIKLLAQCLETGGQDRFDVLIVQADQGIFQLVVPVGMSGHFTDVLCSDAELA